MKTSIQGLGAALSNEELERMTKVVEETLAFENSDQNKKFSTVDLWKIHRQRKSIQLRRPHA